MPQVTAARLLGLAPSTLSEQLHRIIERRRTGHRIRGLTTLGIDEISYAKGHKYATLVYDLERSRVVWVGQGKARETIDAFFRDRLSAFQKARIRWACCDMSETFIGAIRHEMRPGTILSRSTPSASRWICFSGRTAEAGFDGGAGNSPSIRCGSLPSSGPVLKPGTTSATI